MKAPAPGIRGVVLAKKPAAELKLSKQKLVQGMVEFSLETTRAATAAVEEAAAAHQATAGSAAAADGGGGGAAPSQTTKGSRSKVSSRSTMTQAVEGGGAAACTGSGVKSARTTSKSQQKIDSKATTAGGKSHFWERSNIKEGENAKDNGGGGRNEEGISKGRKGQKPEKYVAEKEADGEQEREAEWEGVTWGEGDLPETVSLGTVGASGTGSGGAASQDGTTVSLGTVELASKPGDTTQSGLREDEPQDVLICLKGVVDMRKVM